MPAASHATRAGLAALFFAGVGLATGVAGSFLPWLRSGDINRNSYQLSGVADRLNLAGSGLWSRLVDLWPLLGPLCLIPLVIAAFRWWKATAAAAVVLGAALITATLEIQSHADDGLRAVSALGVRWQDTGPVTVLSGGALAALAGLSALILLVAPERRAAIGQPPIQNDRRSEPEHDPTASRDHRSIDNWTPATEGGTQ